MSNQRIVMVATGAALVVGFFLPWLDVGGAVSASGWDIVREDAFSVTSRMLLGLVPLAGLALAVAALGKSKAAASVAVGVGGGILGYTFYKLAWGFVKTTGIGLWMVLAAAVVALCVGLASRGKGE